MRVCLIGDAPALAAEPLQSALYLEVESLAPIRAAVAGLPVTIAERTTFYGAREIGVREAATS